MKVSFILFHLRSVMADYINPHFCCQTVKPINYGISEARFSSAEILFSEQIKHNNLSKEINVSAEACKRKGTLPLQLAFYLVF